MQASPLPDPTVLHATRGDPVARAAVVERHGPRVFAMCRRLAPDPEDCYQEIWEKVLGALDRFDPAGAASLGGWIRTIARRHLTDRHRRRKVRGEVVPLTGLAAAGPDVDENLARHERRQLLEAAVQRLPPPQRRVVVLHHIHGVPLDVLAQEEGVAIGTIKSRLHRGRARLAALLRGER